jgi:hypothetical protein
MHFGLHPVYLLRVADELRVSFSISEVCEQLTSAFDSEEPVDFAHALYCSIDVSSRAELDAVAALLRRCSPP